jgi:hypothetical protein
MREEPSVPGARPAAEATRFRLLAELLPDNARMLGLLESAGVPTLADPYFGVLRVHLFLDGST